MWVFINIIAATDCHLSQNAMLLKGLGVLGIGGWPWTSLTAWDAGVFTCSFPPCLDLSFFLSLPLFPLPLPLCHLPLFIWSLKLWNCGIHPPFFQSPLKFIGFSGGLPVLLPRGNRDQSIHYFDRDGYGSLCTVPITRTSRRGSPLFSAWPPIQDSPLSPHYAALLQPFWYKTPRYGRRAASLPNYMAIPSTSLSLQNMRCQGSQGQCGNKWGWNTSGIIVIWVKHYADFILHW